MMASAAHSCSNAECKVRVDGICAEGRSLADCPYYRGVADGQEATVAGEIAANEDENLQTLEEAGRLASADAAALLQEFETNIVAVVGPSVAGKTSLIAGLYDLFLQGPVGSYEFAGSKTLHAFEEVCHGARLQSGLIEPNSERTLSGPAKFFELTLGTASSSRKQRLLIADRWGEDYKSLLDSHPRPEEFFEIARADVLTMLVDGDRILDPISRYEVSEEVVAKLQVFSEVGLLARKPRLALVLTKLDVVKAAASGERAFTDFDRLLARITRHFSDDVEGVTSFKTAASPKVMGVKRGEGLSELLGCWVERRKVADYVRARYVPYRQIDALSPPNGGGLNG